MNNSKLLTTLLIISLVIILGFFFLNNVIHAGFHIGHNHDVHTDGDHADNTKVHEVSPGVVVEKIKENKDIILLDVRTPEEYTEIHLENSLLLPVGELSAKTLADIGLGEDAKDKEIIIYCRSGARSKQAYDIMDSLGYTNIKSVAGGMVHWQEDNYPFTEIGEYGEITTNTSSTQSFSGKIVFDRIIHDFGNVPQSQGILKTTFEVKNGGRGILEIGDLSTSCGCTTAEISSKSIQANETATLTVYFDPDFHKEPADKLTRTVFIPTNDPGNPEAEVKITVDILEGE